jgi:hypothetical protein
MMLGHDRALIYFTSQNTQNSTTQLMKKERKKMKQASDSKQASQQTMNQQGSNELNN